MTAPTKHDPKVMPHPDGMRTGRWEVRMFAPTDRAKFGEGRLRQIEWHARPVLVHEMHRDRVRHLTSRHPSFASAMRSATIKARREQRDAYAHYLAQEARRAR